MSNLKDGDMVLVIGANPGYSWTPVGRVAEVIQDKLYEDMAANDVWIKLLEGSHFDSFGDMRREWNYGIKYVRPLKDMSQFEKACYGLR